MPKQKLGTSGTSIAGQDKGTYSYIIVQSEGNIGS